MIPSALPSAETLLRKSRLVALLDHFAVVEDPRDVRRITHRLDEILRLVVCGTIADCDDYEDIAAWGRAHLDFLRRHLPFEHGVPGERWLTILMNRINPALFAAAFAGWVRESWPGKASLVAIDGKTSRRSHDRAAGAEPLHLVSAFATTARLVLAQEAVPDKANELAAIPVLLERLGVEDGLKGALVSIDAIATNAAVAKAITDQKADYLLAVKANQPTLRAEVEAAFAEAPAGTLDSHADLDKGHGRIEERRMTVLRETDWLDGARRFPGELRLPKAACLVRAETRVESRGASRTETRYFISSRALSAAEAATVVREHWAIENRLHWILDVTFADDQSRLRKGHGARHGHGPPLRPQPRPNRHRQAIHQVPKESRRMGPRLPRSPHLLTARLNLDSEPWAGGPDAVGCGELRDGPAVGSHGLADGGALGIVFLDNVGEPAAQAGACMFMAPSPQ